MRRVVVTGLGLVTPLADGVEESWSRILDGKSGAGPITGFDTTGLVTTYACEVPLGDGTDGTFNADAYMLPKEQRKVDTFIQFGLAAAQQAVEDSGWMPTENDDLERTGVLIGFWYRWIELYRQHSCVDGRKGPTPRQPVLCTGCIDQSDLWPSVDQIRLQRPEPLCCDGMFHRRARDWRRVPFDHVW